MATESASSSGGRLLADALLAHGIDTLFCVPGESFLGLLDGLYALDGRLRVGSSRGCCLGYSRCLRVGSGCGCRLGLGRGHSDLLALAGQRSERPHRADT